MVTESGGRSEKIAGEGADDYHPKDRMLNAARGTYTITGLMPGLEGQQPQYRIKHFSEDFERVAFENELSAE